jgi:hypothetical protein
LSGSSVRGTFFFKKLSSLSISSRWIFVKKYFVSDDVCLGSKYKSEKYNL